MNKKILAITFGIILLLSLTIAGTKLTKDKEIEKEKKDILDAENITNYELVVNDMGEYYKVDIHKLGWGGIVHKTYEECSQKKEDENVTCEIKNKGNSEIKAEIDALEDEAIEMKLKYIKVRDDIKKASKEITEVNITESKK